MLFIRICFLALLTSLLPYSVIAQEKVNYLDSIKSWYKETETRLDSCVQKRSVDWADEKEYSGFTPETIGYLDTATNKIIKIKEKGEADWHEEWKSFYLKNDTLFFLFVKGYGPGDMFTAQELNMTEEELWESGGEAKTVEAYEYRVYFSPTGEVLKYITKEKTFTADEQEFDMSSVKNSPGNPKEIYPKEIIEHVYKTLEAIKGF